MLSVETAVIGNASLRYRVQNRTQAVQAGELITNKCWHGCAPTLEVIGCGDESEDSSSTRDNNEDQFIVFGWAVNSKWNSNEVF